MIKNIVILALLTTTFSLAADLYTDTYMSNSGIVKGHIDTGIPNSFSGQLLTGKKTVAHTSVYFHKGIMTERSQEALQELLSQSKSSYYVSVIGHTSSFTNESDSIELNAWAEFWQNLGTDGTSKTELTETVNSRIQAVCNYLQEHNVPTNKIYNENRMDRDPVSTEATDEGKALNNRVDVTLYY